MPAPIWLSYFGAITGGVGAVAGVAGAIMGYTSYRRSGTMKALDLRLELQRADSDLRSAVQELPDLLARAKQSHTAIAAATGSHRSGAFQRWEAEWQADLAHAQSLGRDIPAAADDHSNATHRELEAQLIRVHAIASQVSRLRDKYLEMLRSDDNQRDQLRADQRARTQR